MNTSSLIVKPLERQDHAAWRALWTGYLDFYKSKVSEAVYATTFDRLFADGPYEPRCLLAWDGGTAVGLVHFMAHRHCWRVEDVCYLQDLFASPEARGKGVGRALINGVSAALSATTRSYSRGFAVPRTATASSASDCSR